MSSSPFTYHNKIVDAVMRTIRNALGAHSNHKLWNTTIMDQLVYYYNNTYHNAINQTPTEFMEKVMQDIEHEWAYIRKMTAKLNEVTQQIQRPSNGSVVMVRLEFGKTDQKHDKRRRVYEDLGYVIDNNKNGNILLLLITRIFDFDKPVEVPTFAVRYLTSDVNKLVTDKSIRETFNVSERMIKEFNEKIKGWLR